jgi:hypothetical protein
MRAWNGPLVLVGVPDDTSKPFHFEQACFGLCGERLHLFVGDGQETITVRHGDGEALHGFTPNEYHGIEFLEWIASVHRYEEGR